MRPLVSVGMAARNAERLIAASVCSLLQQTYQNWELIIIDDGSSDATVECVRRFADPRIKLRVGGSTLGLAARLNQAIDSAGGKYFARLDADDVAYPERLDRQVAFLERHPEIDLLGTGAMVFASDGRAIGLFPLRQTHAEICANPWSGFYLAHPTWMGRREWFRAHRYRADMHKAQDQELLLRTFRHSCFACLPDVLLGYRQDRLSLRKILHGRRSFCAALVSDARRHGAYAKVLYALAAQASKGMIDAIAIGTGLGRNILRHRAVPALSRDVEAWQRVWAQCTAEIEHICAG